MDLTRYLPVLFALLTLPAVADAQESKQMLDHDDYDRWNRISGEELSGDGAWLLYSAGPSEGDGVLHVKALRAGTTYEIPRGAEARFTEDARHVVFLIEPRHEAVEAAEKAKAESARGGEESSDGAVDDDEPRDSLGILSLATGEIVRTPSVQSFRLPEEASGRVAYLLDEKDAPADTAATDTTAVPEPGAEPGEPTELPPGAMPEPPAEPGLPAAPEEDESGAEDRDKEEGTTLILRDLADGTEWRFADVTDYHFSDDGRRLVYAASSESGSTDGVYTVDTSTGQATPLLTGIGEYKQLAIDEAGDQVAFVTNRDDWAADQPLFTLYQWHAGNGTTRVLARAEDTPGIPAEWTVSEHGEVYFSGNGQRLFFGTAPKPDPDPDTIPEDERVRVDIWNWQDGYIQPMQLARVEEMRERGYLAVAHLADGRVVQLATPEMPDIEVGAGGDADVALGVSNFPYRQLVSWDDSYYDIYLIDIRTGERDRVVEQTRGYARLSPEARYATWYDREQQAWFGFDVRDPRPVNLTAGIPHPVFDELADRPEPASSYGSAGWTEDDGALLVYDAYDIWAVDPTGRAAPRNITEGAGRRDSLRFRHVDLDPEEEAISPSEPILLSAFHTRTKAEGFYRDRVTGNRAPEQVLYDDRSFSQPDKAEDAPVLLFTRSTFREFPDLWVSDLAFDDMRRMSDANPQQSEYRWGTAELVEWRSSNGAPLQGVLYKPDGFDPSRQYPMMVYFYERLSDRLNRYYIPAPGSSSINISFYVSRGYLVFMPDIPYQIGYPGESALEAVVPGVLSLVDEGFVDPDRIGVQGHSWGGYQIAYMVTKTNMFAAAEAGAPVANMTSAYGGIRWGTGMSRMFQYEQTQSRLGGSLWESPLRYIENSPLFWADKIETPLLMMHNDEDTAVPWEQGIEMFVALRRLNKPVWLLNYNEEPHGLRRDANQEDWAIRMQQFFDHYLLDAPPPVWMAEGVPAIEKGRTLGLELVEAPAVAGGGAEGGETGRANP